MARWPHRFLFACGLAWASTHPAAAETFGDLFPRMQLRSLLPGRVDPSIAHFLLHLGRPPVQDPKSSLPLEVFQPNLIGGEPHGLSRPMAEDQTATIAKTGIAVWNDLKGRTASGELADPNAFTAGHRTLPFGSRVKVVNALNGRSVIVRVNDRGPKQRRFIIDLSRASARALQIKGTAPVRMVVEQLGPASQSH